MHDAVQHFNPGETNVYNQECTRRDLNPHVFPDGGFRGRCVYQFRHGCVEVVLTDNL